MFVVEACAVVRVKGDMPVYEARPLKGFWVFFN